MTDAETASSGARKLAIFLDGTWDQAIGNTNVWRLKSLCAPGADQLIFYSPGVGTSFDERLRGAVRKSRPSRHIIPGRQPVAGGCVGASPPCRHMSVGRRM
jgi:uncharacterized protein (DUF2235 family)